MNWSKVIILMKKAKVLARYAQGKGYGTDQRYIFGKEKHRDLKG